MNAYFEDDPPTQADMDWQRLMGEALERAPLPPPHQCVARAGNVVASVSNAGGDLTLEHAVQIIRAVRDEIELDHALRVSGLEPKRRGRKIDIVMLTAFLTIERSLNRRFAPWKKHTDQNEDADDAYDADAALFENVCNAVGILYIEETGNDRERNRCLAILDTVKDYKGWVNGKRRRRRRSGITT